jgi:hypothetical protein
VYLLEPRGSLLNRQRVRFFGARAARTQSSRYCMHPGRGSMMSRSTSSNVYNAMTGADPVATARQRCFETEASCYMSVPPCHRAQNQWATVSMAASSSSSTKWPPVPVSRSHGWLLLYTCALQVVVLVAVFVVASSHRCIDRRVVDAKS